jgi:hypothetical protein
MKLYKFIYTGSVLRAGLCSEVRGDHHSSRRAGGIIGRYTAVQLRAGSVLSRTPRSIVKQHDELREYIYTHVDKTLNLYTQYAIIITLWQLNRDKFSFAF